jgi:predicted TPR repeat methyltransferase
MRLADGENAERVDVCDADIEVATKLVAGLSRADMASWLQHIGLGACAAEFGGAAGMDGNALVQVWRATSGSLPPSPRGWAEQLNAVTLPVQLPGGGSLKITALDVVQREAADLIKSVATTAAKARVARESHLGGLVLAATAAASSDGRECWAPQERLLRRAVQLQPEVAGYHTSLATYLEQQHTIDSDDDSDLMSEADFRSFDEAGERGQRSKPRMLSSASSRSIGSNISISSNTSTGHSNDGQKREQVQKRGLGAVVVELERAAAIAEAAGTNSAAALSIYIKLAEVQRKRTEVKKSEQAYLRALQLLDTQSLSGANDGVVDTAKAKVLLKIAKLYAQFAPQQGQFAHMMATARGYCRQAVELDPANTIARYWLAAFSSGGLANADGQQQAGGPPLSVPTPYDEGDLDNRRAGRMSSSTAEPPACAPPEYVKKLFNQYATAVEVQDEGKGGGRRRVSRFDQAMVGGGGGASLMYSAPRKLLRLLLKTLPFAQPPQSSTFDHCVDLGCGTGLAGQLFRSKLRIKRMVGIDLAAGMLTWAAAKTVNGATGKQGRGRSGGGVVYDSVLEGNISEMLQLKGGAPLYDLVVACDTLPYIGGIDALLLSIRQATAPAAIVALTTELMPVSAVQADKKRGYMLQTNGRYAHHHRYVTVEAVRAGFVVLGCKSAPIRHDGPQEVMGLLAVLQRA